MRATETAMGSVMMKTTAWAWWTSAVCAMDLDLQEVVIEDITILYDSVYLPQLEEWYVYEFGADTTFG